MQRKISEMGKDMLEISNQAENTCADCAWSRKGKHDGYVICNNHEVVATLDKSTYYDALFEWSLEPSCGCDRFDSSEDIMEDYNNQ